MNGHLSLWLITYDHDPGQTHLFMCPDRAYADIMGSVRAYAFPSEAEHCPILTNVIDRLGTELRRRWHKPHLPIRFHNLFIDLCRIDLERSSDLHRLLSEIYEHLAARGDSGSVKLASRLRDLFSELPRESYT